jgi:putative phage-type endonuclease
MNTKTLDIEYRSQDWLEIRRTCIGASEAAAACGQSKWQTPYELAVQKQSGEEIEDNEAMRWGRLLETAVLLGYEEDTGLKTESNSLTYQHPEFPWMIATPDGFAFSQEEIVTMDNGRLVEAKTASRYTAGEFGETGSDQVPVQYLIQCQHQMAVMDVARCDLAVLIDGRDFRRYTIHRDNDLIELIIDQEQRFIEQLIAGVLPERTDDPRDVEAVHRQWSKWKPEPVVTTWDGAESLWEWIEALKATIKTHETELRKLQSDWKERMGTADTVQLDGRQVYRSDTAASVWTDAAINSERDKLDKIEPGTVKRKGFSTLRVRKAK